MDIRHFNDFTHFNDFRDLEHFNDFSDLNHFNDFRDFREAGSRKLRSQEASFGELRSQEVSSKELKRHHRRCFRFKAPPYLACYVREVGLLLRLAMKGMGKERWNCRSVPSAWGNGVFPGLSWQACAKLKLQGHIMPYSHEPSQNPRTSHTSNKRKLQR